MTNFGIEFPDWKIWDYNDIMGNVICAYIIKEEYYKADGARHLS